MKSIAVLLISTIFIGSLVSTALAGQRTLRLEGAVSGVLTSRIHNISAGDLYIVEIIFNDSDQFTSGLGNENEGRFTVSSITITIGSTTITPIQPSHGHITLRNGPTQLDEFFYDPPFSTPATWPGGTYGSTGEEAVLRDFYFNVNDQDGAAFSTDQMASALPVLNLFERATVSFAFSPISLLTGWGGGGDITSCSITPPEESPRFPILRYLPSFN